MKLRQCLEESDITSAFRNAEKFNVEKASVNFAKLDTAILSQLQKFGMLVKDNPTIRKNHQLLFNTVRKALEDFSTNSGLI